MTDPALIAGRYQVRGRLGAGSFGVVYACRDVEGGDDVAVKLMRPLDARARELFLSGERAARALIHPGIVRILDIGEEAGRPFVVMELLRGPSLGAELKDGGALPWWVAARAVAQVASALDCAHDAEVVHSDIKPGNVVFADRELARAKLIDFGLAIVRRPGEPTGSLRGTPRYWAPEQIYGRRPGLPASDRYSLGVVFYEMLTGERLVTSRGEHAMAVEIATKPPPEVAPAGCSLAVRAELNRILGRFLAKDPRDRYARGQAACDDLEALMERAGVAGQPPYRSRARTEDSDHTA